MCLILLAKNYLEHFPFVFVANRDEFYNRDASKAEFWNQHPGLLAGKDLKEGGTWVGITRNR